IITLFYFSYLYQLGRIATTKHQRKFNRKLYAKVWYDLAQVRIPQLQVSMPGFFKTMDGRYFRRNEDGVTI
ncbi:hypothetical protein PMAYCL1PPCAC_14192, partial [Pristionchus mayeri]